jgi:hypothetical protein
MIPGLNPAIAAKEIKAYRDSANPPKTFGEWYTKEQVLEYIKDGGYFDQFIKAKAPLPDGQEWVVGFYNRITEIDGKEHVCFCVAPMVHIVGTSIILDRFNDNKETETVQALPTTIAAKSADAGDPGTPGDPNDISDTGNLWP